MSKKKQRKPNISADALNRAKRELYGAEAVVEEKPVVKEEKKTTAEVVVEKPKPVQQAPLTGNKKRIMTVQELSAEYGYVIQDLRSMAVLAAGLFVAMIAVAFALNQVL